MPYYEHAIAPDPVVPAVTCPTLDDAVRAVATWDELIAQRRRDLTNALTTAEKMCKRYDGWQAQERAAPGASLGITAIAMDCAFLNKRLLDRPLRAYGLHKDRFANILSDLRFTLRCLGRPAPSEPSIRRNANCMQPFRPDRVRTR